MGKKSKKRKKAKAPALVGAQWLEERVDCTDEEWALGVRCRTLREEGEPWWAIGRAMDLPGWGESATTGKKAAARARQVYARAFGSHPRTFRKQGAKSLVKVDPNMKELQRSRQMDRKALARSGHTVIPAELSDEEVAAMLKGHRIKWIIQPFGDDATFEQEACIHPRSPLYIIGEGEDRLIEFREEHRRAPVDARWVPAQTRTVRVKQIFEVKK